MVSGLSIAAMAFTMIVPLGAFALVLVYFLDKKKSGFIPVLVGAGVFIVFSMILERLVHFYILQYNGTTAQFFKNPLAYAIYGGLMAAIFEETGRLLGFKLFFKGKNEWKHGVAYGIGHGGLELLYIGGLICLQNINNIIYSVMINTGTYQQQVVDKVAAMGLKDQVTQLETVRQQLIGLPASAFLAGGLERFSTFFIQIALSLLVFYAVKKRRWLFFALAVFLHALLDFSAVYLMQRGVNVMIIEGIIFALAVVSVVFILKSRVLFDSGEPADKTEQPDIGEKV